MNAPQIPPHLLEAMQQVFANYPELTEVVLFGSRAIGESTPRSDIDLATRGINNSSRLGSLAMDLDELPAPQKWDVCAYEQIKSAPFKKHIDECGIRVYRKE